MSKRYVSLAIGSAIGVASTCIGFLLRFNAHELSGAVTIDKVGYSTTYNLYHQSIYQEFGAALVVFGLSMLLIAFYHWSKFEIPTQFQNKREIIGEADEISTPTRN